MDRAALIAVWSKTFGTRVPTGLSRNLMRRFLATELQTRRLGGLSRSVKAAVARSPEAPVRPRARGLQPGGRLLREWNGVTHIVQVTADGFLWNGERYRSLSAIARQITGAHWSGPRFFGLKKGSGA